MCSWGNAMSDRRESARLRKLKSGKNSFDTVRLPSKGNGSSFGVPDDPRGCRQVRMGHGWRVTRDLVGDLADANKVGVQFKC